MSADTSAYTIAPNASIEEAAQKIEDNKYGTLIVMEGQCVVGTVTDGDLRKAYLHHRLFVTPVHEVMNTSFLFVSPGDIAAAKSLFEARFYLRLIPEISASGELVGIVKRDDVT